MEKYHQIRLRYTISSVHPQLPDLQITSSSQPVMLVPDFDAIMDDGFPALVEHSGSWVVLYNTQNLPARGRRNLLAFWSRNEHLLDMPLSTQGLYEVVPSLLSGLQPVLPMSMHLARPLASKQTLRERGQEVIFAPVSSLIMLTFKDFCGVIGQMVAQNNPTLQREALGILDLIRRIYLLPIE